MKKWIGLFLGLSFLVSGCANMSTLHTARLVPEKKTRITLGGGGLIFPGTSSVLSAMSGSTAGRDRILPMSDVQVRRSFGKRFELGAKYSILSQGDIDFKVNLFDTRFLTMSLGAGLGYLDLGSSAVTSAGILRAYPVLYIDFNLLSWLAIYTNGKYHFNLLTADISGEFVGGIYHQFSGGAGLKIGPDVFGLIAELNLIYTMTAGTGATSWLTYQPMGGIYFSF